MNEYINLTEENVDKEHICCAIGDKKHVEGVKNKKDFIKKQIKDGHVFRKLNAQGKIFIEYAPLEKAWTNVVGDNYIYIYCLWVAGSFKGHGYAKELIEYAISDAKNKKKSGLCVITSMKKKPFLSEKEFFMHYGFKVVDKIGEYELLALSFDSKVPRFSEISHKMAIDDSIFTIYYSDECPYTNNCVEEIRNYAHENNIKVRIIKVDTLEKAKNIPCIFNNWASFKDGKFVSNTLLNKNSFEKLIKNNS